MAPEIRSAAPATQLQAIRCTRSTRTPNYGQRADAHIDAYKRPSHARLDVHVAKAPYEGNPLGLTMSGHWDHPAGFGGGKRGEGRRYNRMDGEGDRSGGGIDLVDVCASFGLGVVRGAECLLSAQQRAEVAYMSIYHSQCTLVACFHTRQIVCYPRDGSLRTSNVDRRIFSVSMSRAASHCTSLRCRGN